MTANLRCLTIARIHITLCLKAINEAIVRIHLFKPEQFLSIKGSKLTKQLSKIGPANYDIAFKVTKELSIVIAHFICSC